MKRGLILLVILLVAIFFRTFQIVERFEFAHDGDLYSWIVKDIVVDYHPRLIGQLTTANGIFIGPLFYYILAPFFILTNMDPVGALIPITLLGMLTVFSYYWVFARLFNQTTGLLGAFVQAVLISPVIFDRAVVPSTPTTIWSVWYFYVVLNLVRGNFKVLPILAVLIALIWHIHIALAPALLAVTLAIILSKRLPSAKQMGIFAGLTLILSLPLLVFEFRHHFSQTFSFIKNLGLDYGGGVGWEKLNLILVKVGRNITRLFLYPQAINESSWRAWLFIILLPLIPIVRSKILAPKEAIVLLIWIASVFGFYTFSSTVLSEYYFTNIEVIFMAIVSILLYFIFKSSNFGKIVVLGLLSVVLVKNLYFLITQDIYKKGYLERKSVAAFITKDAEEKGLPCVAVSYITPPGEDVGFRYFFYLNKLHVNQPKSGSPVYTIVFPTELAPDDIKARYGQIGVILPKDIYSKDQIKVSCSGQNANLTDPLFGYTE